MSAWFWMLLAASAAVVAIWMTIGWTLGVANKAGTPTDRVKERIEAIRTGLAAGAGAGAAVGLMLAFRRQRHQEIATALGDYDASERRITDLYTKAADQLGSDKAPVRLAGLYALQRLAQDNPGHRQTIVNLICAYLRMPYAPPDSTNSEAARHQAQRFRQLRYQAARRGQSGPASDPANPGPNPHEEQQVRLTAQRILAAFMKSSAASTSEKSIPRQQILDLDLAGATLLNFDLRDCSTGRADFNEATFIGATHFWHVTFTGGAYFSGATFVGRALFVEATFPGSAQFVRTTFNDHAYFGDATFTSDANVGTTFKAATFKDGADFLNAIFPRRANFSGTTFNGTAQFLGTTFGGETIFQGTSFYGDTTFERAAINDEVDFTEARPLDLTRTHVYPPGWTVEIGVGNTGRLVKEPARS